MFESGAETDFIPFWIYESEVVGPDAASTMSGATDSEFRVRLERFLLTDFRLKWPIHFGRGCCVTAITASSYSTVIKFIDTPALCFGRGLRAILACCSIGFTAIFPQPIRS